MSYNPTNEYGKNAAQTDKTQGKIAGLEQQYQAAILGGVGKDGKPLDQDALRSQIAAMRALLGEIRVRAQEITQDMKADLDARKNLLELAKA